jgi:hypothetical protein
VAAACVRAAPKPISVSAKAASFVVLFFMSSLLSFEPGPIISKKPNFSSYKKGRPFGPQ